MVCSASRSRLGSSSRPAGIGGQRVAQRRERARRIAQLLLADERDLQRRRQLLDRLGRARPRALVDLDQLLEQAVALGGLIDQLQALGVGRLQVGAPVPLEAARGIVQVVLVQRRDLQHQHAPLVGIGLAFQQLLVGERQPLVIAGLDVEVGDRVQRVHVVGVDLQHALEDR